MTYLLDYLIYFAYFPHANKPDVRKDTLGFSFLREFKDGSEETT